MKIFTALVATVAVVRATTESLSTYIPECAVDCLVTAIGDVTTCAGPQDLECFCVAENYRAIYDSGVACVLQACGNDVSVGEVLPAAASMCEVVVQRSGKPVTSVGYPTSTNAVSEPATETSSAASESANDSTDDNTSENSNAKLHAHVLAAVVPFVLAAAANL